MNALSWLGSQVPVLPPTWLMRLDLSLGWSLVLALLSTVLSARAPLRVRRVLALVLVLWTLVPGTFSLDYWLGLAFHTPSLSAQLLCLVFLKRRLFPSASALGADDKWQGRHGLVGIVVALGYVLLGYLLLLDTFAVLPLQIYAWGFSAGAIVVLLAFGLVPWLLCGRAMRYQLMSCLVPLALLLFAATRLPTGNVWDAVLDPWLWLLLQCALLRAGFRRLRGKPA
jgi:hypothetical protein